MILYSITFLRHGNSVRHCRHCTSLLWADLIRTYDEGLVVVMDCTVRPVGGCALLAVRALTSFLPSRSPMVSVATAFLSRSIFCCSTRLVLEGLWWQENFTRKSTCSFNKFALSARQRLFAQAIIFVTRAFASEICKHSYRPLLASFAAMRYLS